MITVYGATQSRAMRTLWMLEELGLEYEQVSISPGETRTPEFLAVNPNGHVPVLQDGDLKLVESMAINLYLAGKYGGGLWPADAAAQGQAYQWSFWAMAEMEADLLTALFNRMLAPEDKRDEARAAKAIERLQAPLKVLDDALSGCDYLIGPDFTVADLNVASVLTWARPANVDFGAYPNVNRWFRACFGREARKTAAAR